MAMRSIQQDGVRMIEEYISKLKESGEYDALAAEMKKLNLEVNADERLQTAISYNG